MSEFERIAQIVAGLGPWAVGIGDDAAILPFRGMDHVWTIDAQVEDVHFRREWLSLADLGYRAIVAAASDVLAMGATVRGLLIAWTMAKDFSEQDVKDLVEGQRTACALLRTPILGGNLTAGPSLTLTTTVLGETVKAIPRTGAQPGDWVMVAGDLGHAALGLYLLQAGERAGRFVDVWRRPTWLGHVDVSLANALIDVSDGLVQDVEHLAEQSKVSVELFAEALVATFEPDFCETAAKCGLDAQALTLFGGEDYALVATAPQLLPGFRVIGKVNQGAGVWLKNTAGCQQIRGGFDHFLKSSFLKSTGER